MDSGGQHLVDACLEGDINRVCAIVDAASDRHPLFTHYVAIYAAVDALVNHSPLSDAYRKVRRVLDLPVPDAEIFLLLVRYASLLAIRMRHLDEARRLFRLIRQFESRNVRPEVRAAILLSEASLQEALADFGRAAGLINRALELDLTAPSTFWVSLKAHRTDYAIRGHEFDIAERDINDIEAHPKLQTNLCVPVLGLKVQLCCECGRAEQGLAMLDSAQGEDAGLGRRRYLTLCIQMLIKSRRLDEAAIMLDQAQNELAILTRPTYENLLGLEAMAQGDLRSASAHARAAISDVTRGLPVDFDMSLRTLAGAELAATQPSKARRILKRLDPYESKMPIQMLWARLYMLEGNEAQAAEHFQRVAALGPAYVEQLVRDASELSAYQLARLQAKTSTEWNQSRPSITTGPPQELDLVGRSAAIQRVRSQISSFASLPTPVLITGETGTGKDVAARLLHGKSSRAKETFIPVNCGALSDTLIESELFGHLKGAFTGADRDHDGLFIAAGRGTIFLDEIHAMSKRLQASLLRVLENGEVRPVGSSQFQRTQTRVIAATNESIEDLIDRKHLRSDLYYRLAKLHVHIPPLRDRQDDITILANHFLRETFGQFDAVLGDDLIEALRRYAWPGNVRELKNEIERIVLTAGEARVITAEYFEANQRHAAEIEDAGLTTWQLPGRDHSDVKSDAAPPRLNQRHTYSRRRRLRELFDHYDRLTRAEVIQMLGCSPNTATRDLRALEQEGAVRRVHTSAHLRTSYFVRNG